VCLTKHARKRLLQRGNAFGVGIAEATKMTNSVVNELSLTDALVILAASTEQIKLPDGSNGNLLCARLRDSQVTTVLLRRATQKTRLDGLVYVIGQTLEVL